MTKIKSTYNNLQNNTQKDRQYNGQKKKYIQQSTKQYTEGQTFCVGHCIVCPSVYCFVDCCMHFFFWPLYCLSFCVLFCRLLYVLFLLVIVLSVLLCINGQKKKYIQQSTKQYTEGQTIQWPTEKVQITIYKTIHRRTDNTMAFSFGHCIVCPSVYCFVDCCMYFFFWPLCCLSFCVLFCRLLFVLFLSAIVLSVILCIVL
jgi:hypothetical protein